LTCRQSVLIIRRRMGAILATGAAGFIGFHACLKLLERDIEVLENALGKKAVKNLLPMQPGDVFATFADVEALTRDVGFRPSAPIEAGVERLVAWFHDYYRQ